MIAFNLSTARRRKPIVILTGLAIGAKSTNHFADARKMLSRALSVACKWLRCNCTPRNIARALFSAKVSTVVAVVCLAAMWWHNVAIDNTIEAQEAVGLDCLLTMPWAIVWAFRAARMPMPEEGGEL